MTLKKMTPNLMVHNLQETVEFYTTILGFEVKLSLSKWVYPKKDHSEIMFQSAKTLLSEFPELLTANARGGVLILFIQMDNINEYYEKVKDKVKIIRSPGVTPYNGANEFVIQDLNNTIFHFS